MINTPSKTIAMLPGEVASQAEEDDQAMRQHAAIVEKEAGISVPARIRVAEVMIANVIVGLVALVEGGDIGTKEARGGTKAWMITVQEVTGMMGQTSQEVAGTKVACLS